MVLHACLGRLVQNLPRRQVQFLREWGFDLPACLSRQVPPGVQDWKSLALWPGFFIFTYMWHVYAIKSINRNYIYVGLTNNIVRRLYEHNKGYNKTTKPYLPFVLIHTESFETRTLARAKEKYLKGGSGKKFLKSL